MGTLHRIIIKRKQAKQYLIKGNILKRTYCNANGTLYISYIYVTSEPYGHILSGSDEVIIQAIKYRTVELINNEYKITSKEKRYFIPDLFNGTVELIQNNLFEFLKEDEFRI